jgi:hypothetical protein
VTLPDTRETFAGRLEGRRAVETSALALADAGGGGFLRRALLRRAHAAVDDDARGAAAGARAALGRFVGIDAEGEGAGPAGGTAALEPRGAGRGRPTFPTFAQIAGRARITSVTPVGVVRIGWRPGVSAAHDLGAARAGRLAAAAVAGRAATRAARLLAAGGAARSAAVAARLLAAVSATAGLGAARLLTASPLVAGAAPAGRESQQQREWPGCSVHARFQVVLSARTATDRNARSETIAALARHVGACNLGLYPPALAAD